MSDFRSQFKLDVQRTGWLLLAQSVVINLAMLALPVYTLQLFDRVLISGSIESLLMLLTGVSLFAMAGALFEHLRRTTINTFADHLGDTFAPVISHTVQGSSVVQMQELQRIRQYLKQGTFTPILDAIWLPLTLIVAWFIHPAFGLFIVAINGIFLIATWLKQRASLTAASHLSAGQEKLQRSTNTGFGVNEWISASGLESRWKSRVTEQWQQLFANSNRQDQNHLFAGALYSSTRWLFQLGLPTLGALLLLTNQISIGAYLAALIVGTRTMLPFDAMFQSSAGYKEASEFIHKLAIEGATTTDEDTGYSGDISGNIQLNKVSPVSDNSLGQSIEAVSLSLKPGAVVALVGDNGLGAEAVIKILAGESDYDGEFTIDGLRHRDWAKTSIDRQISYISHEHRLPQLPVMELITHLGSVDETTAYRIAEATGLNQIMINLDIEYSDVFQNDWYRLSAGRALAQSINITAALTKAPKILLLNHPESCLDHSTLNSFIDVLKTLRAQGTTVVMATQSKSLTMVAEEIHQFHEGRLARSGALVGKPVTVNEVNS